MKRFSLQGRIFRAADDLASCRDVQRFRKRIFVDQLGWSLNVIGEREQDQFDRPDAIHFALRDQQGIVGCFRALPCDGPYLCRDVFPALAQATPYPHTEDCWEISRLAAGTREASAALYAAMLDFGWTRNARALVALVDLGHERVLRAMRIRTQRYGMPTAVGVDRNGRTIQAVAGEIPLGSQSADLRRTVSQILASMDLSDETLVLGPDRISA